MCVDHCRAHVFVAQEFLNCANVVTIFKQVSRERMTKRVRPGWLGDADFESRIFDRFLEDGFVEVMAASFPCRPVGVMAGGGKDPLPRSLCSRVWVFAIQSVGQHDSTEAILDSNLLLSFAVFQIFDERLFDRPREFSNSRC